MAGRTSLPASSTRSLPASGCTKATTKAVTKAMAFLAQARLRSKRLRKAYPATIRRLPPLRAGGGLGNLQATPLLHNLPLRMIQKA